MRMMNKINEYDLQAQKFLLEAGATITKKFKEYGVHFNDDVKRNIWTVTIKTPRGSYTFEYGDSVLNSARFTIDDSLKNPTSRRWLERLLDKIERNNSAIFKPVINLKYSWELTKGVLSSCIPYHQQHLVWGWLRFLNEIEPSDYSILSCLNLFDWESFDDFCSEYWYSTDSIKSFDTYNKVIAQDRMLRKIFTDEQLQKLQEIV